MNSANADRVARVLGVNRQWLETGRDTPAIPAVDEQGTLESRLLMAFSLLLENQKIPAIEYIENIARENAQMYKELLEKYGTAVPDEVVAKFLPMPPA